MGKDLAAVNAASLKMNLIFWDVRDPLFTMFPN